MIPGTPASLRRVRELAPRTARRSPMPPQRRHEYPRDVAMVHNLGEAELLDLVAATCVATATSGQTIYRADDTAVGLFLLKRGRVRLYRGDPGGLQVDLAIVEPGSIFGDMPLLGVRTGGASAEAIGDATFCVLSRADVEHLVLAKPWVALRALEFLAERLATAEARLEDLAFRSVRARLASVLLRLAREYGTDLIAGITHQELADTMGTYRETVTKVLNEMEGDGLVALARRRIRILDRDELLALLNA